MTKIARTAIFLSLALLGTVLGNVQAWAAPNNITVQLSDSRPATPAVSYTWTWSGYATTATTRCVLVTFSSNADGSGGIPTGMNLAAATLTGTYGGTWTADYTSASSGRLAFNFATGVTPAAGPRTLVVGNVTNPNAGSYYQTITTYNATGTSGNCGGSVRDAATVAAFATVTGQQMSGIIDSSFGFTVAPVNSGTTCGDITTNAATATNSIAFGRINSASTNAIAGQNLTITSNANSGYYVSVSYSGQMTGASTSHLYPDVSGTNAAPAAWPSSGTEALGYATSSSTLSGTSNRFRTNKWAQLTTSGAEIMRSSSTSGPMGDTNCIAYQMSRAENTPADTYQTVVIYNAIPNF